MTSAAAGGNQAAMSRSPPKTLLFLLAPLAACDDDAASEPGSPVSRDDLSRIECRLSNETSFERFCLIERRGDTITLFKPDGGFRRLRREEAGSLVAADGADPARVSSQGATILVQIGGDAFLLPAQAAR